MREPRRDDWAEAKWISDRPTKRAGRGTRILAFFFMIPAGAFLANLVALLLFAKAFAAYPWLFFPTGSTIAGSLPIGVVGAILGALSVIHLWPSDDEGPADRDKDRPSSID